MGVKDSRSFGYIRVSSKDQNMARQLEAVGKFAPEGNIFVDQMSGKDFERPAYRELLMRVKKTPGAVIYVLSIDRLGRNYIEIQEEWQRITKKLNADIVILDMPLLDTRRGKDLMGTFLADIVLQILSFVAENERVAIRKRQAEGIAAAKKRGVQFGRKQEPLPANFIYQYERWRDGTATLSEAAKACGMSKSTFFSRAKTRQAREEKQPKK